MASRRSTAADHEGRLRGDHLPRDGRDAVARLSDRPRPKLAA